jgi:hypothetical protein
VKDIILIIIKEEKLCFKFTECFKEYRFHRKETSIKTEPFLFPNNQTGKKLNSE